MEKKKILRIACGLFSFLIVASLIRHFFDDIIWGTIFIFVFSALGYYLLFYPHSKMYERRRIFKETSLTKDSLDELEEGVMPVVDVMKLVLNEGEMCHYYTVAIRLVTKDRVVGYSGESAGVSIRVAKGISLRTGGYKGVPIRGEVTDATAGELYLTNERLIFVSKKDNFEIPLNKIIVTEIFKDGIGVQDNKKYYLMKLVSPYIPYAIIKTLIEEKQAS